MALGAILGGVARGATAGRDLAIGEERNRLEAQRLKMAERQNQTAQENELDEIVNKAIQSFTKNAVNLKTSALEVGTDETQIAESIDPFRQEVLRLSFDRAAKRPGASPESVEEEVRSKMLEFDGAIQAVIPPGAAAAAEAEREVASSAAAVKAIDDLPPEQQEAVRQHLGFDTKESTDAFFRALEARDRLIEEGKEGSEEFNLVEQRLQSLVAEKSEFGISFQVGEDGRVESVRVGPGAAAGGAAGAGLAGELTGSQLFTQDQRVAEINDKIGILDRLVEKTIEDPEDFGLVGSARRGAQTIASGLSDLASLVSSATGETVDLNAVADTLSDALGIENVFDPDLSQQQILESELAISLAKLRLSRGGGDIRALQDIFRQAKQDVTLTGFTSSEAVRNRLKEIKALFESEKAAITSGLGGESEGMVFEDLGDGRFRRIK